MQSWEQGRQRARLPLAAPLQSFDAVHQRPGRHKPVRRVARTQRSLRAVNRHSRQSGARSSGGTLPGLDATHCSPHINPRIHLSHSIIASH